MGGCSSRFSGSVVVSPAPQPEAETHAMIVKSAEVNPRGEDKPVLDTTQQKEPLKQTAIDTAQLLDVRRAAKLPAGSCLYLQSGDPGDVDGYLIGVAGEVIQAQTKDFKTAIVVPERRACPDRAEQDVNKHDQPFSEQVMEVAWQLLNTLCPDTMLVRGPVNARNIIPLKFIFSEPDSYAPLLVDKPKAAPAWKTVQDLATAIEDPGVTSLIMDMNGSMGYLNQLIPICPSLGPKLKASGMPICIMAGILSEVESKTLRVPGRDPRATMNAIYDAESVRRMLDLATKDKLPLLFVTNNICNDVLKYDDAEQMCQDLGMSGLLKELAAKWYGPHLHGRCVPFDWVCFCAMLLYGHGQQYMTVQRRQLFVGKEDASVLVLHDPATPRTPIIESQLEGTELWGEVGAVTTIDKAAMQHLARACCAHKK